MLISLKSYVHFAITPEGTDVCLPSFSSPILQDEEFYCNRLNNTALQASLSFTWSRTGWEAGQSAPIGKERGNRPVNRFSVSVSGGNDQETVVDTRSGTIYILRTPEEEGKA